MNELYDQNCLFLLLIGHLILFLKEKEGFLLDENIDRTQFKLMLSFFVLNYI